MSLLAKSLIGFFLLPIFFSCSSAKQLVQESSRIYSEDVAFVDDKVLVLLVDLELSSAQLRGAKIVDGSFKPLPEDFGQKEVIRVQYLDDQHRILFEKVLDHPLIQYKEYDDEKGKIQRIRIEDQKGSVLLRSQHSENVKLIRVEYGDANVFKTIATVPIVFSS